MSLCRVAVVKRLPICYYVIIFTFSGPLGSFGGIRVVSPTFSFAPESFRLLFILPRVVSPNFPFAPESFRPLTLFFFFFFFYVVISWPLNSYNCNFMSINVILTRLHI